MAAEGSSLFCLASAMIRRFATCAVGFHLVAAQPMASVDRLLGMTSATAIAPSPARHQATFVRTILPEEQAYRAPVRVQRWPVATCACR
jgi:hypothetical protein